MKLKKNDILELAKTGRAGILTKLQELKSELIKVQLEHKGSGKIIRRSIARLMTLLKEVKQ